MTTIIDKNEDLELGLDECEEDFNIKIFLDGHEDKAKTINMNSPLITGEYKGYMYEMYCLSTLLKSLLIEREQLVESGLKIATTACEGLTIDVFSDVIDYLNYCIEQGEERNSPHKPYPSATRPLRNEDNDYFVKYLPEEFNDLDELRRLFALLEPRIMFANYLGAEQLLRKYCACASVYLNGKTNKDKNYIMGNTYFDASSNSISGLTLTR